MSKYDEYPNIARVARELACCENPDMILNIMLAVLAANPKLMKEKEAEA